MMFFHKATVLVTALALVACSGLNGASPEIEVLEHELTWPELYGIVSVGIIRNNLEYNITNVQVKVSHYSADSELIGNASSSALVEIIEPRETSPFFVRISTGELENGNHRVERSEIDVKWSTTEETPVRGFTLIDPEVYDLYAGGEKRIVGRVHNKSGVEVSRIRLVYSCRDAKGRLRVGGRITNIGPEALLPGGVSWFDSTVMVKDVVECDYTVYGLA